LLPAQIASSTADRNRPHASAATLSPALRAAVSLASNAVWTSVMDLATLNVMS